MTVERAAILGAGPGGCAAAAVLVRDGYDVALYNRSADRLAPVKEAGGVAIEGAEADDFFEIPLITDDIDEALAGRDLVMSFVPANGQVPLAEAVAPHLTPGMIYLLACGSAGSLEVHQVFQRHGIDTFDDVLLGETMTLPQSARVTGPARVRIRLPSTVRTAAFPAANNNRLLEALSGVINTRESPNVLDTGLNNVNFIIHPGPMLLNYAAIERSPDDFSLMNEGMTQGVLRCMEALDAEKMAICEALGLTPTPLDDVYREMGAGPKVYRQKGEPFNLRDRVWDRYIYEDTPYGTVMLASLGRQLGVPTPLCEAVNALLSMLEQTDFVASGRTAEKLGLEGMSAEQMRSYLHSGRRDQVDNS